VPGVVRRLQVVVPREFADALVGRSGDAGQRWVETAPALVERLCRRWQIELTGDPALYGDNNLLLPARQAADGCMLKLCGPGHDTMAEVTALLAWDGRGAVQLLEASPEDGALLLEQLDGSRSLSGLGLFDAAEAAGDLIRQLTIPGPPGLCQLGDMAAEIAETIAPRQNALGNPVPARWAALAAGLAAELAADAGADLVHADLHYDNVLAGTRQPWLAIDPKAIAGDPELSVPELMWTRLDEAESASDIRALLAALTRAAALDPAKARAWTIVRAADYWLWGLDHGFTQDPVRCHRLLDTLAQ
jgi:streptomycin 6-kinase